MPVPTHYVRISNIVVVGGSGTNLNLGDLATDASTAASAISATIAPSAGAAANLIDGSAVTEATWAVAGGRPVLTLTLGGLISTITQTSGTTVAGQIASATVEDSTDNATWTVIGTGPWNTAATANTAAAATVLTVQKVENPADTVSATDALSDNLQYISDSLTVIADTAAPKVTTAYANSDTANILDASVLQYGFTGVASEALTASDSLATSVFTMYVEAIGLSDALASSANTTASLSDSAVLVDLIRQAIIQVVADSAAGADSFSLGAALTLVDIANAVATQTSTYNSVMLVAELIATLEAYNSAPGYDISETGTLSETYVERVSALAALLESAQAIDTDTAVVYVMQALADTAAGATAITSVGSLLTTLLADSALATIRLNVGGELFTGWVLNTETMAPSEYQFADLEFNSACKHGSTYLMAADDGIYQFTDAVGFETVMTYIKTGKTDFGSDMRKSVIDSYLVYSATGQMALKVTTSVNGQLQTNNYTMTPFTAHGTTAPQRLPVGKGLKSRYWQFELVGSNAGCTFDEIGMLPVILSRRI